ncbi:class I adenylate-forming enzyme family protein [Frigidibacter sp. ROC022]|uniref:class I adenylate-forming enzyme family protein n=1 Tax=Frigidibacter sp. ROC022 TaxID=2971796 RepID=UPI00215A4E3B|nr:class I adenylate-forming enzyme family protein [Frigidibacter sp. ROC022]MCR8724081.1 acyl--CoA ligase [Frigidibacter sp. ROC022]
MEILRRGEQGSMHRARQITPPPAAPGTVRSFADEFLAAAARHPDKIAVTDESGSLTWAEFAGLAARVARRLAEQGIGPGGFVGTLAENSARHLAVYCGTLIAGACIAPLPTSANPATLRQMRDNCGARLLFASPAFAETAAGLGAQVVPLAELDGWTAGAEPLDPVPVGGEDLFDLIYSSGTTGAPKGIEHDHLFRSRQFDRLLRWDMGPEAVTLVSTPLYSNTTLVAVLPTLVSGGSIVTMARFDCARFLELSQQHRVSHAMLVPVQYRRLMEHPGFDSYDLTSYRAKLSTSAPLSADLIARVQARWPGNLVAFYGMTEGGVSCVLDCDADPGKWDTAGRPAPGCDVRVIDDSGAELPPGVPGEVVARNGSMMAGYHLAPEKTAEVVWRSPEGLDFIRTGDIGRIDPDGYVRLSDRKKDMILTGGFNVYASDLEAVLMQHPEVSDAAVIAVPSADWGETPLALVVPRGGARASAEALRDWANARLGKVQRISAVEFRDSLPRSDIGKVLKRELRAPYWPAAGEADRAQPERTGG